MSSARSRGRDAWRRRHEELLARGTIDHYEDAALYDFEYAHRTTDIAWYCRLASEHARRGTILELGAGTGRITCPLLAEGHRVIAIDRMPAMLEALRRRLAGDPHADQVDLLEADIREIPLPDASVQLCIAPFNVLMHLYGWRDLLRAFQEVARVLVPDGMFAFDVQLPDLDWLLWNPEERHAITRFVHPVTRERLIYSTNHNYDPETQICHIRIYYDEAPARGRRFNPPTHPHRLVHLAHRQIFPEELRVLVHTAGLVIDSHTGDFSDRPLAETKESQVVVCHKPQA